MKKTISVIVSVLIIGGAAYAAGNSIVESNNAEEKAFQDTGVTSENVYDLETERDYENEKAVKQSATITSETTGTASDIGSEEAKAIALKHAGVTEAETTRLWVECDRDDGRVEYSVEFYVGNKEYDYEIDAETGKVLEYDIDVDDDWD